MTQRAQKARRVKDDQPVFSTHSTESQSRKRTLPVSTS